MIQPLFWLVTMATTVWVVAMVASILWGLLRFLVAAPAAIRHDLEAVRRRYAVFEPPREIRYVENEAERTPALPTGEE